MFGTQVLKENNETALTHRFLGAKSTIRYALIFAGAAIAGVYLHEIGHAVAGWIQGIAVIPTPAKEYALHSPLEWNQEIWISLGGPVGTIIAVMLVIFWHVRQQRPETEAVLAGVLLPPGIYTLRFLLTRRGHDLEWQAAQTALGLSPTGHVMDVLFLFLLIVGITLWSLYQHVPLRRLLLKLSVLAIGGILLIIFLQVGNNKLFDRFFPKDGIVNIPPGLDPHSGQSGRN